MNSYIKYLAVACSLSCAISASAQEEKKSDWGSVHGGVESNAAFYKKDENNPNANKHGNNTYLNLKYVYRNLSAGLQYEIFQPPMLGYSEELKGHALAQYYANYSDSKVNVTLGSFYEQFGSGLIFRAFEERPLGINNSLRGISVRYTPTDWLSIKAMGGQPRRYLTYANSFIYGADGDLIISRLWNKSGSYDISLGGAWVMKDNTKEYDRSVDPDRTTLMSGRAGLSVGDFSLSAEYTTKGKSQSFSPYVQQFLSEAGDAFLVNLDYTLPDFGVSAALRRVEHMDFRIDGELKQVYIPMNYIPALTKQHKYALPSLYPHQTNISGEIGGQIDIYGNIKADWLGKSPLKVAFNASHYSSLGVNPMESMPFFGREGQRLFTEVSLEVGKRISRALQFNVGVYYQEADHSGVLCKSIAEVVDVLWKINRKMSLRTELQHMKTEQEEKGWVYGLVELGFAPHLSLYASDMYSYAADTKEHYYMMGTAVTYGSLRVTASYGRTRAGLQCVGGICRFVPEYTGFTAGLSYVF